MSSKNDLKSKFFEKIPSCGNASIFIIFCKGYFYRNKFTICIGNKFQDLQREREKEKIKIRDFKPDCEKK